MAAGAPEPLPPLPLRRFAAATSRPPTDLRLRPRLRSISLRRPAATVRLVSLPLLRAAWPCGTRPRTGHEGEVVGRGGGGDAGCRWRRDGERQGQAKGGIPYQQLRILHIGSQVPLLLSLLCSSSHFFPLLFLSIPSSVQK
jgi:hypothetical protein